MNGTPEHRQELENLWKRRSDAAKQKLDAASAKLREVERDIHAGSTEETDYVYRQAIRAETDALIERARVLRIYTDLMAHGTIPEEEPSVEE